MSITGAHPDLKLAAAPADVEARRDVAAENRAAASNPQLDPTDPRWVLAARVYAQLEGTALGWERRQRLMRTARRLGVRPFEANVILAVVQDHARRGRRLSDAAGTIALLEPPPARRRAWPQWLAAIVTAAAANAFLIWWLAG